MAILRSQVDHLRRQLTWLKWPCLYPFSFSRGSARASGHEAETGRWRKSIWKCHATRQGTVGRWSTVNEKIIRSTVGLPLKSSTVEANGRFAVVYERFEGKWIESEEKWNSSRKRRPNRQHRRNCNRRARALNHSRHSSARRPIDLWSLNLLHFIPDCNIP